MDFESIFSLIVPALIATIIHTFLGMAWFGPIFGRQWMKFMEFNKLSASEKKTAEKQMPKLYMGQVGVTFLANIILGLFLVNLYTANPYFVGFMLWLGFVFTSQSTATIWSQTKAKYVPSQIVIATLYQLVSIMIAVALFSLMSL